MLRALAVAGAALAVAGAASSAGAGATQAAGPAGGGFSASVTNPWFPLRPGSVYVYRGVKDGQPSREVMTVTRKVVVVDGKPCVVVRDLLYLGGRLHERTTDWYTQDERGNVWYYGEATAELTRDGRVKTTEGSWRAGKDGAVPGIYMPAHPRVGFTGRQEYLKGHAEDHFRIVSLRARVQVPWGRSSRALLTKEWTPLEPGVVDRKFYVRGVGIVLEQAVKGGAERNELVSFRRGS